MAPQCGTGQHLFRTINFQLGWICMVEISNCSTLKFIKSREGKKKEAYMLFQALATSICATLQVKSPPDTGLFFMINQDICLFTNCSPTVHQLLYTQGLVGEGWLLAEQQILRVHKAVHTELMSTLNCHLELQPKLHDETMDHEDLWCGLQSGFPRSLQSGFPRSVSHLPV